jgi:hypothetical protein
MFTTSHIVFQNMYDENSFCFSIRSLKFFEVTKNFCQEKNLNSFETYVVIHYTRTYIGKYFEKIFSLLNTTDVCTLGSNNCEILICTYLCTFIYFNICSYFFTYVHMCYLHMNVLRKSQFSERPRYFIQQFLNYLC